jgi:hypothetical protein
MEAINITAYTSDTAQIEAVKAVLKAFKIQFEVTKAKPYNPEFVAKIKKSQQDYKEGKGRTVTIDELNALWK